MSGGGFFTDPRTWDAHVRAMSAAKVTLDRDGAVLDLRFHQDAALNPFRPVPFPTSGELAKRWRWSKSSVYRLLCRWREWADPEKLDAFESVAARWNARETDAERERNDTGTIGQRSTDVIDASRNGGGTEAERERNANGPARAKGRVTDHRSPFTDHVNNTGSPTEPTSRHPDGTTDPGGTLPLPVVTPAVVAGPADGGREGNTRAPSVAASASAPRRARASSGAASGIPDDVLAAYAELDPERAASIRSGGHVGIASALAKAASRPTPRGGGIGPERLAARLRYIARNPGDPTVRAWRERTGGEVSQVLRGSNGWTVPIDARVDDLAAKGRPVVASTPAPAAPPVDPAWKAWAIDALPYVRESRASRKPPAGPVPPHVERVVERVGGWAGVNELVTIDDVFAALKAAFKEAA